ncbi:MAG: cell wall-binding repeat-containing protein [Terrisporobacter sp.]
MSKKIKLSLIAIVIILVAGFGFKVYLDKSYLKEYTRDKVAGEDRYETMIKVNQLEYKSAKEAVLVSSRSISDAISVVPFARAKNMPIFFVEYSNLDEKVKKELINLGVENIYIIGSEKSISTQLAKKLSREGMSVERIGGNNGFETSINIAKKMSEIVDIEKIALVSLTKGLPDGVSLAAPAAKHNMPIIVMKKSNRKEVIEFAKKNNIQKTYFIGKENQFPQIFADLMPNTTRITGETRFNTNLKMIKEFYNLEEINKMYLTKGGIMTHADFLDNLALAPIAAKENIPIMLTELNSLNKEQIEFMENNEITELIEVGFGLVRPKLITRESYRLLNTILITGLAIVTLKRVRYV